MKTGLTKLALCQYPLLRKHGVQHPFNNENKLALQLWWAGTKFTVWYKTRGPSSGYHSMRWSLHSYRRWSLPSRPHAARLQCAVNWDRNLKP